MSRKTTQKLANRILTLGKMVQAGYPGSLGYLNEITWHLNPKHLTCHQEDLATVTIATQSGDSRTLFAIGNRLLHRAIS